MKRLQKGFTLIELLVVIAIIGILAGVVLVNVSGARNRARESAIIAALSQLRTDKEISYDTDPIGYKAASASIQKTVNDNGPNRPATSFSEALAPTAYRSSSPLPGGGFYCVDSTGVSKKTTTSPTGTQCPAN